MITTWISSLAKLFDTALKRFVKTPDEKKQALLNEETERLNKNKSKSRKYLKKRLRGRL